MNKRPLCPRCGGVKRHITSRGNGRTKTYCLPCKNRKQVERHSRAKHEVFRRYGNKCACCGERGIEFLTLDHVGGWGAEHRRHLGDGGKVLYRVYQQVLAMGCPPDLFRVLCMNCNFALGQFGYCPHGNVTNERAEAVKALIGEETEVSPPQNWLF